MCFPDPRFLWFRLLVLRKRKVNCTWSLCNAGAAMASPHKAAPWQPQLVPAGSSSPLTEHEWPSSQDGGTSGKEDLGKGKNAVLQLWERGGSLSWPIFQKRFFTFFSSPVLLRKLRSIHNRGLSHTIITYEIKKMVSFFSLKKVKFFSAIKAEVKKSKKAEVKKEKEVDIWNDGNCLPIELLCMMNTVFLEVAEHLPANVAN